MAGVMTNHPLTGMPKRQTVRWALLLLMAAIILTHEMSTLLQHLTGSSQPPGNVPAITFPEAAYFASLASLLFSIIWYIYILFYQFFIITPVLEEDDSSLLLWDLMYAIAVLVISDVMYKFSLYTIPLLILLMFLHSLKSIEIYTLYHFDETLEMNIFLRPLIWIARWMHRSFKVDIDELPKGHRALGMLAATWVQKGLVKPTSKVLSFLLYVFFLVLVFGLVFGLGNITITAPGDNLWKNLYYFNTIILAGASAYLLYQLLLPNNVIRRSQTLLEQFRGQLKEVGK